MKRWLCTILALFAVVLLLPVSRAQAHPFVGAAAWPILASDDTKAAAIANTQEITGTDELTGSVRIATALATHFSRTVQEILDLHAADWGFGNIAKALFTAIEANVSLEQILQLRAQDIGWGKIRQSLGLPAGTPHQSLGQLMGHGNGKDPDWVPPGQLKKPEKNKGPKGKP